MQVEFKKEISKENHTKIYSRIGNYVEWHLIFVSIDNPLSDEDYWTVQDLVMKGIEIGNHYSKIEPMTLELTNIRK